MNDYILVHNTYYTKYHKENKLYSVRDNSKINYNEKYIPINCIGMNN